MTNMEIILLTILIMVILIFVYDKWKYLRQISKVVYTLQGILEGNENLKIYIENNDPLESLVFKINILAGSYQDIKIATLKKEQSRRQMLSNLSHDVRTPLTSVLGYLDALYNGKINEKERIEYIHIARRKAYELKEYIDELFTMARIDADELKLNFQNIDLFELLRIELIGWVPDLQDRGIELKIEIPDEECFVIADQHALTRVFNNMLQNALRYGGIGGVIGVSAWIDEKDAYFQVWDKGPGVPEEEVPMVFHRLYKVDSSRKSKGHGLGLAIAKELVEKMNGKIHMKSVPYTKTFVQVSVPGTISGEKTCDH